MSRSAASHPASRCFGFAAVAFAFALAATLVADSLAAEPAAAQSPAAPQIIAIKAGRLIDPEAGTAALDQVILVEGGMIKEVGAGIAIPKGAEVIDLSKATVLPGLFDCHTHLCIAPVKPAGETPRDLYGALLLSTVSSTTAYRAIHGVANAKSMLESGFTTVRDVGNSGNYADTDLRRAIEEGIVPGPTIVNAGRIIAATGGQYPSRIPPFFATLFGESEDYIGVLNPERPDLGNPEYLYADTADEFRKAIRENALYGARVIKIVVDDQRHPYTSADIRVIVEEARIGGLKVCAHSMTDAGARAAAEGGVASIEHGFLMSDETMTLMKKNGVTLVGTDFTEEAGRAFGLPPGLQVKVVERLRRAHAAGVTLAYGTDVFFAIPGKTIGESAISFVDTAIQAGMKPAAILKEMIPNAARLLGVEKERGSILPGMSADIIASAADPLEDASALKKVGFVMKNGRIIRR